jgi:hypothetical protein
MWKTWEKDDFIDQIELLSDINKKYFFTDVIDKQEIAEFEDEGIWQTIITIIGSTYRNPKRKHIYLRYLEKAQVLSNNDCKKREELNKYIRKRFLGLF